MTAIQDTALILAQPEDVHALSVAKEIERINGRAIVLDTAHYPAEWNLSSELSNSANLSYVIRYNGEDISSDCVAGVWYRRPRTHTVPASVADERVRQFCIDESRAAFQGWVYSLGNRVINPLAAELAASRKPLQLHRAIEVGLRIPDTVITNARAVALRFLESHSDGTIFKVLTGTSWQITETREFLPQYAEFLDKLAFAPAIFQELIRAVHDIRVTIVDDSIFAVSIHVKHPGAMLDWRLDLSADVRPHDLPAQVGNKLLSLMRALGLRFGAIDLRLTPEGDYCFLEVNPGGQFLFCEIHANQQISRALAHALLGFRTPLAQQASN